MASFGQTAAILNVAVRADTHGAAAELNRFNIGLTRTSSVSKNTVRDTDRLNKTTRRIGPTMATAAKSAVGLAAGYVGLQAASQAVDATADLAAATIGLKKNFGLTIQTASGLGAALVARGGETSTLATSFTLLSKKVEEAKDRAGTARDAFTALGISQKELKTNSPDKTLFAIADGMERLGKGTERTAVQSTLFGKAATKELIPALRGGSDALKGQIALAEKYGASFGGKSIKSINDLIAAQRELKIAQLGLQVQFTEKIAPSLIKVGLAFAAVINWVVKAVAVLDKFDWKIQHAVENAIAFLNKLKGPSGIGVINALINALQKAMNVWGNFRDVVRGAIGKVIDGIGNLLGKVGNIGAAFSKAREVSTGAWQGIKNGVVNAGKAIVGTLAKIVRVVSSVISAFSKLKSAPGNLLENAGNTLGDIAGHIPGLQRGGVLVGGSGSGDKVPAMLEPGEVVLNREAVKSFGGPQRANAINRMVPRFASGGVIGGAVGRAGQAGVSAAAMAAIELLKALKKAGMGSGDVSALLAEAKRMDALHQPYLWGGGHAGFSRNGPWDCSGAVSQMLHGAGFPISSPMVSGSFESYGLPGLAAGNTGIWANGEHVWATINGQGFSTSSENPGGGWGSVSYNSRPGFVKRHANQSRTTGQKLAKGAQMGGIIQKFAGGGIAKYNHTYPRQTGPGGTQIPFNHIAAIAEEHGLPGITMAQVSIGESNRRPGAVSSDGGYGMWQMTPSVQSASTRRKWEAIGSYFNPFKNAKMAKLLPVNGGTYHGSGAVTGWNQHFHGTIGKTQPTPKTTKGSKTPSGPAAPAWALEIPAKWKTAVENYGGEGGTIAQMAEWADRASSLGVKVGGKDELGWLNAELNELRKYRDLLLMIRTYIVHVINQYQKAIATAKAQIARLKKGKMTPAKRKAIDALKAKVTKWTGRRDSSMALLTDTDAGPLGKLSEIQGFVNPKSLEFAPQSTADLMKNIGAFGGTIGDVQGALKTASETSAAETGTSTDTTGGGAGDNSAMLALLQTQADNLAKQLFVSEQSYKVLASTPYVGSFASGGMVPGIGPKLATVHGGEYIGKPGSPTVVVLVEDGAVDARRIRAISGQTAEKIARRAGRGRIPGRAGAMH